MLTNTRFYLTIILFSFPYLVKATPECEQQWIAKLVSANGRVEKQHYRHSEWNTVKKGEYFCQGDRLRTNRHSRVTIELGNESLVTLEQSSTLSFPILNKSKFSWILDLFEGGAFFRSRRPHQLEVDTPFVNAVHEGTEFLIRVTNQQTEITVFDGRVAAENKAGRVLINEHQIGTTGKDQITQIKPLTIHPKDAVQWALYYPPIVDFQNLEAILAFQPALENYKQGNIYHTLQSLEKIPERQRDQHFFALKASLLLTVGSVNEALQEIEHAQQLKATSSAALAIKSIIAVTKNQQQEALKLAKRATELNPSSVVSQIALSYALQAAFKISEALKATQQAIKLAPGNALAWARLAELQLSSGERSDALESAKKARQLNPQLDRTQTVLGFAYLAQIDIDEAKTSFNQAINLNSAEPLARLGLGLAKIRKGDIKEGTRDIEAAVTLDPDNSIMRSYLGKAYYELRNEGYAATELAIAKKMDPNDPTPWFYDAILKQTTNRPVEALHDMQKAIELNNNRGVYRSKLLLDEDLAGRSVSLARIYNELGFGFDQPAINLSSRSLDIDPSNYSAHRFLADAYSQIPRHEASRASELLQAQLLQPININPVQPETAETKLNFITDISPSKASFNEFTPLFERNGTQFTGSGIIGSHNTISDQAVLSGIYNNLSYSFGQFHYSSEGFRENNEVRHKIYNAYTQLKITDSLNLQFEYRKRKTEEGDLRLKFNPRDFSHVFDREIDQEVFRAGALLTLTPNSQFIVSFQYVDRDDNTKNLGPQGRLPAPPLHLINESRHGYDIQAQYILKFKDFNFLLGGGHYNFEGNNRNTFLTGNNFDRLLFDATLDLSGEWHEVYFYSNILWPKNVAWTFGLEYVSQVDAFNRELKISSINPKFGIKWGLADWATLRGAAFQSNKRSLIFENSLQPTQIAGFSQQLDNFNGTRTREYSIGIDLIPTKNLFVGFEFSSRELKVPFTFTRLKSRPKPQEIFTKLKFEDQREEQYKAYLNWTPFKNWVFSAEYQWLKINRTPVTHTFKGRKKVNLSLPELPTELQNIIIPFGVRYFDSSGLFGSITATYVDQKLAFDSQNLKKNHDDFFLIDISIGYRLPKNFGVLSLKINNIFDQKFNFQDTNVQSSEPTQPLFIPDRTILGQLTLNY